MTAALFASFICLLSTIAAEAPYYSSINEAPHSYLERELHDPFTRFKRDLESGRSGLDHSESKAFLRSLLKALNVPEESQVLVFSTTSLQLSLISPSNPRAIYFNEEVYVGFIPGGKIEVLSIDPELGGVFYIFPIPRPGEKLQAERSGRCMNCHAGADSRYVPGLVIQSVVPAPGGGSLDSFRKEETGHQIPYDQRFGGWYVTGGGALTNHWANLIGRMRDGEITKTVVEPGQRFDWAKYLVQSSDLLPHLLLEHQAGFINRVVEATYRARTLLGTNAGQLTPEQDEELKKLAHELVRYLLFADEPTLPEQFQSGPEVGDREFKKAFLANRRASLTGMSLKDFDLRRHLFAHRCSYMIYSPVFDALPRPMKILVARELEAALRDTDAEFAYISPTEKHEIRTILRETLPGMAFSFN